MDRRGDVCSTDSRTESVVAIRSDEPCASERHVEGKDVGRAERSIQ
jgi:hypothetical protein